MRIPAISIVFGLLFVVLTPAGAELPYDQNGWTKHEAAAHLLSRLTFGPQQGQVERVAQQGLESWLEQQLEGTFANTELKDKLAGLPQAYALGNAEILALYPAPGQLRQMVKAETGTSANDSQVSRQEMKRMRQERGLRPQQELGTITLAQKLYHARYSESQVREVLTEFWFNHFNVAAGNNRARPFILSYERDVLRPFALAPFRTLLGKTAKHPAMLWYLDNATSTASADAPTSGDKPQRMKQRRKGLNENYARELMELHTLGVDGGYSQNDVTEAARVLTGWTSVPYQRPQALKQVERGAAFGMERQGDFVFAGPLHDSGSKTVLGVAYPAGVGMAEGETLLDQLAAHPSTAKHLARKFAVRFVSDQPSERLVTTLSAVFTESHGDPKAMLRSLVHSDEFWQKSHRGAKIKSPLEFVVSAARILNADLQPTPQLYGWLVDMGQPLYNFQAPTGFPDQAEAWINSGTVLQRMNFGLQAANGGVMGFSYSVRTSRDLGSVISTLLPGRDARSVLRTLEPMLNRIEELSFERPGQSNRKGNLGGRLPGLTVQAMTLAPDQQSTAAMIGLVLGSPEFQRR